MASWWLDAYICICLCWAGFSTVKLYAKDYQLGGPILMSWTGDRIISKTLAMLLLFNVHVLIWEKTELESCTQHGVPPVPNFIVHVEKASTVNYSTRLELVYNFTVISSFLLGRWWILSLATRCGTVIGVPKTFRISTRHWNREQS